MSEYGLYLDGNSTLSDNIVHVRNRTVQYRNPNFISTNIPYYVYAYHSPQLTYQDELVYGIQETNNGYIADVIDILPTNLTNGATDYGVKIDNYELTHLSNNMFCYTNEIDCFNKKQVSITLSPQTIFVVEFVNNSQMFVKQKSRHNFTLSFDIPRNNNNVLCAKIHIYEAKKSTTPTIYGIHVNDSNINSTFISNINNVNIINVEPNNQEQYVKYLGKASIRDVNGVVHFIFYKTKSNKLLLNSARILTAGSLIYENNNILYMCGESSYDSIYETGGDTYHGMPYNTVLDVQ